MLGKFLISIEMIKQIDNWEDVVEWLMKVKLVANFEIVADVFREGCISFVFGNERGGPTEYWSDINLIKRSHLRRAFESIQ